MAMEQCWLKSRCNGVDCDKPFCMKKFKLDLLYEKTLLPEKYKKDVQLRLDESKVDLESFQYLKSVQGQIERFVSSGDNLYIHSPICGNGKTSWAVKLLKEYLFRIWPKSDLVCKAMFIHVPRYLLALKDNISEKSDYVKYVKDNILDADLVVFDEVATGAFTKFEGENILSIVNSRVESGKSNIYTSNLSNGDLLDKLGERLYSRIVNCSQDVVLLGQDKRGLFQ